MHNEINIFALKEALENGKVVGMWDNRGEGSFDNLHIKGAKQLSVADVAAGKELPEDKDAFIVFY